MFATFKRTFDFISSLLLFVIISPLFLVLCILVAINLGRPIMFTQVRSGKNMKSFKIMKFRTMAELRDENGELLPDDKRLTKFGSWLRATSLDELPELINIIKGDMSVIGPRPLHPAYNEYYTEREQKRFSVRGGLIPPEVLHNNIEPTWDEQLEYEADYAEKLSFRNDINIFIAAFKGIFKRYEVDYGNYVRESLIEERERAKNDSINTPA